MIQTLKDWFADRSELVAELRDLRDGMVTTARDNTRLREENALLHGEVGVLRELIAASLKQNEALQVEIGGVLASIAKGETP